MALDRKSGCVSTRALQASGLSIDGRPPGGVESLQFTQSNARAGGSHPRVLIGGCVSSGPPGAPIRGWAVVMGPSISLHADGPDRPQSRPARLLRGTSAGARLLIHGALWAYRYLARGSHRSAQGPQAEARGGAGRSLHALPRRTCTPRGISAGGSGTPGDGPGTRQEGERTIPPARRDLRQARYQRRRRASPSSLSLVSKARRRGLCGLAPMTAQGRRCARRLHSGGVPKWRCDPVLLAAVGRRCEASCRAD